MRPRALSMQKVRRSKKNSKRLFHVDFPCKLFASGGMQQNAVNSSGQALTNAKVCHIIRATLREIQATESGWEGWNRTMSDMTSVSLKDRVYAQVLHDVISGEYGVESIISEKKILEQMQVSKAPVREALIHLCAEGVLSSVPRQGYVVVRYGERELREILDYRAMIECGSLEASFDHITRTQLRRLESIVEGEFLFLSANDARDFWQHTFNFHLTLMSFSENEFAYERLDSALSACMRAYRQLYHDRMRGGMPAPPRTHRDIVEYIRQGERQRAVETLRRDIYTLIDANDDVREEMQNESRDL